jgi:hypothetical protein
VARDFGQAARYHATVIAHRASLCLELGIATVLAAGLSLMQLTAAEAEQPSAPALAFEPPLDPLEIRSRSTEQACEAGDVSAIVIRGQFTSREHSHEGFAISFAGTAGRYTAFTDHRGYFEVRIPREDFVGDLCELPAKSSTFSDPQMNLEYRLDFE